MSKYNHAFVVCAYKESRYLEECVQSIVNQSVKTPVVISTSTPNDHIYGIANKYGIEVIVNHGKGDMPDNFNFAIENVDAKYLTVAHQDDFFHKEYARVCMKYLEKSRKPLICFTNYAEARNGQIIDKNKLLTIKRILLAPLKCSIFRGSRFVRRRILSLGNPICCPSVTFARDNITRPVYTDHFKCDIDWEAWEKISKLRGDFVYVRDILTYHRIHEESGTSESIADNYRKDEDYEIFCKFWPKWIAKRLTKNYAKSEKSNEL